MSKKVEIYDQYSPVYSDNQQDNSLVLLSLNYNETIDTDRYTLVHPSSGFSSVQATGLNEQQAIDLVTSLYENSKTLGTTYTDKIVKLSEGYAELIVSFEDGKSLCRVIYTVNE